MQHGWVTTCFEDDSSFGMCIVHRDPWSTSVLVMYQKLIHLDGGIVENLLLQQIATHGFPFCQISIFTSKNPIHFCLDFSTQHAHYVQDNKTNKFEPAWANHVNHACMSESFPKTCSKMWHHANFLQIIQDHACKFACKIQGNLLETWFLFRKQCKLKFETKNVILHFKIMVTFNSTSTSTKLIT